MNQPKATSQRGGSTATPSLRGETFASQLTPAGRSAIAVVLVRGPGAAAAVDASFAAANGLSVADQPTDAIRFGRWGGERGEELVVCRRSRSAKDAPTEIEIHCHGGRAAVAAVLADLAKSGCQVVDWGCVADGAESNFIRSEARVALAEAATERAAAVLLGQLDGALERATRSILEDLEANRLEPALRRIETLLGRQSIGRHLTRPWRVTIVGPPNVGKSRLLNALVGYDRAIVYDKPGTTRDLVTTTTAIDGWPATLSDTAGLRDTDDPLEAAGVAITRETLAAADLLLIAAEAGPGAEQAWRLVEEVLPPGRASLRVVTKGDLQPEGSPPVAGGLVTSAATGAGIEALLAAIAQQLVPMPPQPGEAVPFTERQIGLLTSAVDSLRSSDPQAARPRLQSLLC